MPKSSKIFRPKALKKTRLEDQFAKQLCEYGFRGQYRRDTQYLDGRKFRADFLFPKLKLVVEIDGGEWMGNRGGHTSGKGYTDDRVKDHLSFLEGYTVFRFAGGQVKSGYAIEKFQEMVKVLTNETEGR